MWQKKRIGGCARHGKGGPVPVRRGQKGTHKGRPTGNREALCQFPRFPPPATVT